MEEHNPIIPETPPAAQSVTPPAQPPYVYVPPMPPEPFPTGKRELTFACSMALICLCMANFVLFGGFFLGFALTSAASILCSAWYLTASGQKGNWYTWSVLGLCLVICASFGYSSDPFVKLVLLVFLAVGVNLALCQQAGQNRRSPGSIRSVLDAPRAVLSLGLGKSGQALRGLARFFRSGGETSRRTGAILAGIAITIPVLFIMVPLLMASDAAFEGLMDLLPDSLSPIEIAFTLVWGTGAFLVLYSRGTALRHTSPPEPDTTRRKGLHRLTVNTLLLAVCGLYLVYFFSQIAYFSGGFLGILPQGYSVAQYARRGFFEMAWLCAINLGLITFAVSFVSRDTAAPLSTRLACLFLGLVTLFLVSASCGKMFLYIGSYGLTRLRVLTMVVIVFFALITVLIALWLFIPRIRYMKAVMLIALAIAACVVWTDVDSQVARYNVDAYLSGELQSIDTAHLGSLGPGAVPHIARLREAEDPLVAQTASDLIENWYLRDCPDLRSWTYQNHIAREYLPQETEATAQERVTP